MSASPASLFMFRTIADLVVRAYIAGLQHPSLGIAKYDADPEAIAEAMITVLNIKGEDRQGRVLTACKAHLHEYQYNLPALTGFLPDVLAEAMHI